MYGSIASCSTRVPPRRTKTQVASTLTAWTGADPCVEAGRRLKLVGVIGSSKLEVIISYSDRSAPRMSRCSDRAQLMLSTGPEPIERWIGPESPSTVSSKLKKPSDTEPYSLLCPNHHRRPWCRLTEVGKPRNGDQEPSDQIDVA